MQETPTSARRRRQASGAALVLLVLAAFCVVFVLLDQGYVRLTDSSFPRVGESWTLATAFGLVSRLHLILRSWRSRCGNRASWASSSGRRAGTSGCSC